MPSRHVIVRAIILSPENTFRTRIPVLFPHTLEESGKEEVVPVTGKVDAIRIARQRISDYGLVAVVVYSVIAVIDHMVAIQVLDLHISRISDTLGRRLDQCLVSMAVDIGLILEQPLSHISPDFTYTLAGIVVIQVTCLVVIAVDGRDIVGQRTTDLVVERFLRQCELVAPS